MGQILVFCKDKILHAFEVIKQLVERNNEIRRGIPSLFIPLMKPLLLKMENAFMPAMSSITWTSMKIPQFCVDVTEVLNYIEMFVKEVGIDFSNFMAFFIVAFIVDRLKI